eukprot:802064-Rhodomonas_salina.5
MSTVVPYPLCTRAAMCGTELASAGAQIPRPELQFHLRWYCPALCPYRASHTARVGAYAN